MDKLKKMLCLVLAMGSFTGCSTITEVKLEKPIVMIGEKELSKKQYILNNTLMIESDFIKVSDDLEIKPVVDNLGTAQIVFDVVDARVYNFLRSGDEKLYQDEKDLLYETILEFNGKRVHVNNRTLYTYAVAANQLNMLCLIDITSNTLLGFDGVEIQSKKDLPAKAESGKTDDVSKDNSGDETVNDASDVEIKEDEPIISDELKRDGLMEI